MVSTEAVELAGDSQLVTKSDDKVISRMMSRSIEPTPKQHSELRHVKDDVPLRLWVVAFIGFWERAAFWGLTAPWQNYMEMGDSSHKAMIEQPRGLGLGQVKATRIYCGFYMFYYFAPIFIAPLADNHLGQYKTLLISVILYCVGCTFLTLSSLPTSIERGYGLPGMITAMGFIALGGGGFKAIMAPFIADQHTERNTRVETLKSGERVIRDYQLTLQYIYNLYFWLGNVGSLSWFATVYLEKEYGFHVAYGLTLGFITIAMILLVSGKRWYIIVPRKDNVLPDTMRIIKCAMKNGFKMKRADPRYQDRRHPSVVTWNSGLVDEITRGLRACRVLVAFVMFYICFDQMQNNLISQAGQMKTNGTPNDLIPAMNQVGCIVFGPLVQEGLYPLLHKRRIYIGPIARITIGFMFISLAMLYATFIQHAIYVSPPCYNHTSECRYGSWILLWGFSDERPNVWLQTPLYFLIAIGEIFAYVSALEYVYDHSPEDMKVLIQAISLFIAGVGSACALMIAEAAHDPNLMWLYTSLASGMTATTIIFWLVFRSYDTVQQELPQDDGIAHDARISDQASGLGEVRRSMDQ